ncbi:hypothetical protein SAMN05216499_11614 [Actinacidiphila paucisporea]|uniref:Uncharacterized protein n=1 Tax=Actinacidiphila paucisporea TaxID=310782 RepID=A0A1M7MEY4_9ACTN|nr:hypothetical protein SAMN05216499_11614 [Actinacidiphila paucisporea]
MELACARPASHARTDRPRPLKSARKAPGWTVVWSTVLRCERSAAAVEPAAVFLGRGRVGGIGRGDRRGRPGEARTTAVVGCGGSSARRIPASVGQQVPGRTRRFGRRTERLRSTLVSVGLALAGPGRRPDDGRPQGSGQSEHPVEADRLASGPSHRSTPRGRRGRVRPAQGPCLRNRARRRRDTTPGRPSSRSGGGHVRGLARRAARHRDRLPGPGALLRRRCHPRRPTGTPGRRPMASLAQPGRSRREVRLPAPWLLASHTGPA